MSKHYLACTANELDEAVEKVLLGYKDVTPVTASAGDVVIGKKIVDATGKVREGTLNTEDYYNSGYSDGNTDGYITGYSVGYATGLEEATPTLQSKEVIPSLVEQNVTADSGYDGLLSVLVNAIPQSILEAEYQRGYDEAFELWKPYKTALLYIESTGTQHINTMVNPNNNTRVVLDADVLSTNNTGQVQLVSVTDGTNYFVLRMNSGFTAYQARRGSGSLFTASHSGSVYGRHLFDLNKSVISIDGVETRDIERTFSVGYPIYICTQNNKGARAGYSNLRIYSCKIYDNDVLVRDYIPVLDWSDVPCLYDKVNRKFYYNEGTGAFNYYIPVDLPEGYTQVPYIHSTGTQYIDTGYKPNHNSRIEIKYQTTQTSSGGLAVCNIGWGSNGFGVWVNASQYGDATTMLTLNGSEPITAILDKGVLYKDGEKLWTATQSSFQTTVPLTIFALNGNGNIAEYVTGKLYYCKIWDDGTLIRDYVPCVNSVGTAGLYDLVNNKFYTNAGTGTFTYE